MTAQQLIAILEKLPPDRRVCVDVSALGFVDIVSLVDEPEAPGALLEIDDQGEVQDAVRAINAGEG